ncbi:rhomboid family intramembrane serine protease [candidate division KSB1 bacterium]|nr:rhomboid family intramembrane serine protease [candidate division KSB1 bacterium]
MYYYEQTRPSFGFGGRNITTVVKYLLIANAAVYLLQQLMPRLLIGWFALFPNLVLKKFFIWQLFTYMFLHGDFLHILLNMFILWMFGCEVERYWGNREFLKYYVICGIGGALFHIIFHSGSMTPVIGASGAIYGILAAFAMFFPDRPIMLFPFFITLKAKHWVLIFLAITLLFGFTGAQDGIAHFAHLGGMVVGFVYIRYRRKFFDLNEFIKDKKEQRRMMTLAKKRRKLQELRDEVDSILDKINEVGYENLTDDEKKILKNASDYFSKE